VHADEKHQQGSEGRARLKRPLSATYRGEPAASAAPDLATLLPSLLMDTARATNLELPPGLETRARDGDLSRLFPAQLRTDLAATIRENSGDFEPAERFPGSRSVLGEKRA